jgi:hypothetical protein
MKRIMTVSVGLAVLLATAFGCSIGGRKTHLVQNSPYVNASSGQLIEEDSSDDGWFDFTFDAFWDAIFGSSDKNF